MRIKVIILLSSLFFVVSCNQSKDYYKITGIDSLTYYSEKNNCYSKISSFENAEVSAIQVFFKISYYDTLDSFNQNSPVQGSRGPLDRIDSFKLKYNNISLDIDTIDKSKFIKLRDDSEPLDFLQFKKFKNIDDFICKYNNKEGAILMERLEYDGLLIALKHKITLKDKSDWSIAIKFNNRTIDTSFSSVVK